MLWFGSNKDVKDNVGEVTSDDEAVGPAGNSGNPVFEDKAETHYVYVTQDSSGEQFIMSTPLFSPSLPLLCSGSQEICDAYVEGHRAGFRNLSSRRQLLLSVLSEEYIFAHKLLCRLVDGEVLANEFEEEIAFFEKMRSDTRSRNEDRYFGNVEFAGDKDVVQPEPEPESPAPVNVIQMANYFGVNDGAA